jgi:hypothetical protein
MSMHLRCPTRFARAVPRQSGAIGRAFSVIVCFTVAALHGAVAAAPPVPANRTPIAVRDGVVGIPLVAPPLGEGLPARPKVRLLDEGRSFDLEGTIVWLVEPAALRPVRWTRSANPLAVRTLPDDVDPRVLLADGRPDRVARVEGALLLVDVPPAGPRATLEIGREEVRPIWLDAPPPFEVDPERGAEWSDDTPDPESPFEWFRWVLVAQELGSAAPAPPGDAGTQLLARHVAGLWLAALARIERESRGAAAELRSWLIAVSERDGRRIATWVADAASMNSLLSLMLDPSRDDETVMRAALAWMDARTPLLVWTASDRAGTITLVFANPLEEEVVAKMQWLGENEPPLATLVEPRGIEIVVLERPQAAPRDVAAMPEPMVLLLEAGAVSRRIAFAPGPVRARPPALSFGVFVPALSLAALQSGRIGGVPASFATEASLRRRAGRWELFVEARRPDPALRADPFVDAIDRTTTPDVLVARIGSSVVRVTVRADGSFDVGGDQNSELLVAVSPFADRWRCRIQLPPGWLPRSDAPGAVAAIGLERSYGPLRSTAVVSVPSIDVAVPQVEIDLGGWGDAPTPRGE